MYLLGSIVIWSRLRQYLICVVDLPGKKTSVSQPFLVVCANSNIRKSYWSDIFCGAINIIFFSFSFSFQEIIFQKNNVSMMYGFLLNYKHSRLPVSFNVVYILFSTWIIEHSPTVFYRVRCRILETLAANLSISLGC